MSLRKIALLFAGPAGSGKDTSAKVLVDRLHFHRYAIADQLKDIVSEITRVPRDYFDDVSRKDAKLPDLGESPRDLCIRIGTVTLRKHFGDSVFVDSLVRRMTEDRIVVTDVRFQSDYENLRAGLEAKGYKVRLIQLVPVEHDGMTSWTTDASVHDVHTDITHYDALVESRHGLIGDLESRVMHYVMTEFLEDLVDV
jgi:hypothetical protein